MYLIRLNNNNQLYANIPYVYVGAPHLYDLDGNIILENVTPYNSIEYALPFNSVAEAEKFWYDHEEEFDKADSWFYTVSNPCVIKVTIDCKVNLRDRRTALN